LIRDRYHAQFKVGFFSKYTAITYLLATDESLPAALSTF
jgi:hypothetical protein